MQFVRTVQRVEVETLWIHTCNRAFHADHAHAECLRQSRDLFPDFSDADDNERLPIELSGREAIPAPVALVPQRHEELLVKREHHHDAELGQRPGMHSARCG
jgi:hypothetical protein